MLKGKLTAALLGLVLLVSISSAALFKYPVTGTVSTGQIVYVNGSGSIAPALAANRDAIIGVVVTLENDTALVSDADIYEVTLPAGVNAGDRLTVGTSPAGSWAKLPTGTSDTNVEGVLCGIAMEDGGGTAKVMIMLNNSRAKYTAYSNSAIDVDITNVAEALDTIIANTIGLTSGKITYTGTVKTLDDAAATSLISLTAMTIPTSHNLYLSFTGEFDDKDGSNGAVVDVNIYDGSAIVGVPQQIVMMDRQFFQNENAALTALIAGSGASTTYSVRGQEANTYYDSGRFVRGTLSWIELP